MNATVVGLVTPHVLAIVDLARQAEGGVNVDWHLRDAVARSMDALGHHYNARDLMEAWCEERGREWLVRHSPGIREFLEAAGFDPDEDEPAEGVISGP